MLQNDGKHLRKTGSLALFSLSRFLFLFPIYQRPSQLSLSAFLYSYFHLLFLFFNYHKLFFFLLGTNPTFMLRLAHKHRLKGINSSSKRNPIPTSSSRPPTSDQYSDSWKVFVAFWGREKTTTRVTLFVHMLRSIQIRNKSLQLIHSGQHFFLYLFSFSLAPTSVCLIVFLHLLLLCQSAMLEFQLFSSGVSVYLSGCLNGDVCVGVCV